MGVGGKVRKCEIRGDVSEIQRKNPKRGLWLQNDTFD